mgnify:CR=1 FL=1
MTNIPPTPISKPVSVLDALSAVLEHMKSQVGQAKELIGAVKDTSNLVRAVAAISVMSIALQIFFVLNMRSAIKKIEAAESKLAQVSQQMDKNLAATKVVEKATKETSEAVEAVQKSNDETAKVTLVPDSRKPEGVRVVIMPPRTPASAASGTKAKPAAKPRAVEVSGRVMRDDL